MIKREHGFGFRAALVCAALFLFLGYGPAVIRIADMAAYPAMFQQGPIHFESEADRAAALSAGLAERQCTVATSMDAADADIRCVFSMDAGSAAGLEEFLKVIASHGGRWVGPPEITHGHVVHRLDIDREWLLAALYLLLAWTLYRLFAARVQENREHAPVAVAPGLPGTMAIAMLPAAFAALIWMRAGMAHEPDPSTLPMLLTAVIAAPVCEEVVFRVVGMSLLRRAVGVVFALFLTSFLFAWGHDVLPFSTVVLFLKGILFGVLWLRTGDVRWCIGAHVLHNAVVHVL